MKNSVLSVQPSAPEDTGEYIFTVSITNKQGKTYRKDSCPDKIKRLA